MSKYYAIIFEDIPDGNVKISCTFPNKLTADATPAQQVALEAIQLLAKAQGERAVYLPEEKRDWPDIEKN